MPVPLELFAEVTTPDGTTYRWHDNQAPGSRLRNFSFRTKLGEGFSDASGQLARRIDADYPDLNLMHSVTVTGADGSIAYEGRIAAMPRELSDSHSIGVTLAGWMAHAKDRKFQEIYVDRDLAAWGPASRARKIAMLTANLTPTDSESAADPVTSQAGVSTAFTDAWASPYKPTSEAWYDAGPGLAVGQIRASWKIESATISVADVNWIWEVFIANQDDLAGTFTQTSNLRAAGPGSVSLTATAAGMRYAVLRVYYNVTPGGAAGARYGIAWYKPAVYGTHTLNLWTGDPNEPPGVTASEVIRDVARRFCPMLDVTQVMDTSYVIPHLAFKDRTFPYDAFLEVNKYHLWHLAVWEKRQLTFRPYDLTDYVWEIRTDDPGTTISLQGPSTDDLWNGAVVTYTDLLTGQKNILTPAGFAELQDLSPLNPWNQAGVQAWGEIELSSPTLQPQALQIGRAKLADNNRPKTPGSIQVRGYVRDRAGNDQPVWKVRAGDTVVLSNFPNDTPRLIHETSYDGESKTVTLSVERPAAQIDAMLDRVALGLQAAGLS